MSCWLGCHLQHCRMNRFRTRSGSHQEELNVSAENIQDVTVYLLSQLHNAIASLLTSAGCTKNRREVGLMLNSLASKLSCQ